MESLEAIYISSVGCAGKMPQTDPLEVQQFQIYCGAVAYPRSDSDYSNGWVRAERGIVGIPTRQCPGESKAQAL